MKYLIVNNLGFSLLEVILGITIIAIVLSPILSFLSNSIELTRQVGLRCQAINIARLTLEEMKAEAKKNWGNLRTVSEDFNLEHESFANFSLNANYKLKVELKLIEAGRKEITATVLWDNELKKLNLVTIVANR